MRKVTQQAVSAFLSGTNFKSGNTSVEVEQDVTILKLHGNKIAYRYDGTKKTLKIRNAGWFSNTTKERLNGLPGVSINQKKGVWYLNGKEWNGELIEVK